MSQSVLARLLAVSGVSWEILAKLGSPSMPQAFSFTRGN